MKTDPTTQQAAIAKLPSHGGVYALQDKVLVAIEGGPPSEGVSAEEKALVAKPIKAGKANRVTTGETHEK